MKTPVSVKNRHWCFVSYYMLNHPEVLQRLFNCLFLLRRALRLLDIFGLWLIVVLTLNDTAFLLYLCDIQAADLQAAMLQHIILNLLIGSFFLCISQIQLVQIQLHLDMLLGVEFGQKYNRLHMGGAGEHVHRLGFAEGIAQGGKALYVPGQGGRVAGDVHNPLRGHGGNGVHHVLGQALPGRIHAHHVGLHAPGGQGAGGLARVAAEELGVGHPVAQGVLPGVLHRLGHHLGAEHPARLPGHHQADGADAAVQVQHGLRAGETGEIQGPAVEHLGLVGVDLVEGGHGQPEGKAAQGVLQSVPAPEGAVGVAQDDVVLLLIDPQHHARQPGLHVPQGLDQSLLLGHGFSVDQQAEQGLSRPVHPDVHMAHQPPAGFFVVGGDIVPLHPGHRGGPEPGGSLRLEQAVLHRDDLVGPLAVEARSGPLRPGLDRELDLVAVPAGVPGAVDDGHRHIQPGDALKAVLHPDALGLQLLGVVHVPELAAAALGVVDALGHDPGGGGLEHPHHPAEQAAPAHLLDAHVALLAPDAPLDKDHNPVQPGHARTVGGVPLDDEAAHVVYFYIAVEHSITKLSEFVTPSRPAGPRTGSGAPGRWGRRRRWGPGPGAGRKRPPRRR